MIDKNNVLMVEGNDIVIRNVNSTTIYVSADVTGATGSAYIAADGTEYIVGVSAFASLKDISTQVSVAPCTHHL